MRDKMAEAIVVAIVVVENNKWWSKQINYNRHSKPYVVVAFSFLIKAESEDKNIVV